MLRYKIDVLEELKGKGYNTTRLRKEKILSESTIQRLREGKTSVSCDSIGTICSVTEQFMHGTPAFTKDVQRMQEINLIRKDLLMRRATSIYSVLEKNTYMVITKYNVMRF